MKPTDTELYAMIRQALPPESTDLNVELWPRMLRRLDEQRMRMSWLDRGLLLLVSLGLIAFPAIIPQLLYQL